jgi:hypothetical protein
MNSKAFGDWHDPRAGNSSEYLRMFSHIQTVFAREGITAAHIVWSWNTFNMPAIAPNGKWGNQTWDEWYPGDDAVSWVGINAFTGDGPEINGEGPEFTGDGSGLHSQQGYNSVQEIYASFYLWVKDKRVHGAHTEQDFALDAALLRFTSLLGFDPGHAFAI